jgi:hypothetical protein
MDYSLAQKMAAVCSSEMLGFFQITQRYNSEDCTLHEISWSLLLPTADGKHTIVELLLSWIVLR